MSKKVLPFFILFFMFVNVGMVFSADVELTAYVYKEYTIFNYIFSFDQSSGIDKISIEKPKDAEINYIVDKSGPVNYSFAGDYLILNTNSERNNVFFIKFKSKMISDEIRLNEAFRTYQNFNFPVENFVFEVQLRDNFGEIINTIPSNSTVENNSAIKWIQQEVGRDSVFIVNFKKEEVVSESLFLNFIKKYYVFLMTGILIILFLLFLMFIYPRYLKKHFTHKNAAKKNLNLDINSDLEPVLDNDLEKTSKDAITEIIEKHLTENEKSVVNLIKTEEGISQYDILNYIPSLTKSNLSKIITKLDSKRILKRIKVGKVNHIYLGEKLKGNSVDKIEEE